MEVKDFIQKAGLFVERESPSILTGIGSIGFVTTVVLAIKATPMALYLRDEIEEQEFEEENKRKIELLKANLKCYFPTIGVGLASLACFIGANSINLRRNAALASAYSLAEIAFKEYQEKVVEQIGKNKEEKVRDSIAQDRLNKNPVNDKEVIILDKGDVLFYDSFSGRYFKSNVDVIRRAQNNFNRDLLQEMYKPINDFYYEIGLEPTNSGRDQGWNIDYGMLDIHFSSKLASNDVPCIVLDYRTQPKKL